MVAVKSTIALGGAAQAGSSLRLSDANRVPPKELARRTPHILHPKPYDVWNSQLHSPSNLCTILYTEGKIARRRPDEPSVHAGRVLTHDQLLQWVWGPEKTGQPWLVREVV